MSNSPDSLTNLNNLQVHRLRVVVVYTEWNDEIMNALTDGCKEVFDAYPDLIRYQFIQVPGCVEIPFTIHNHYLHHQILNKADVYIAFGCVIRGETAHFDYVCQSVTQGITQLNITLDVPTIFGVLTVDNMQQAKDRIGGSAGHKGKEAAITAIKMVDIKKQISKSI
jgi:6,7-dimethyl-8-ribityllumazine synthase